MRRRRTHLHLHGCSAPHRPCVCMVFERRVDHAGAALGAVCGMLAMTLAVVAVVVTR